ncbi:hypothetical protein DPMN_004257 [Dreissena polymorpha]|uniref:Uncharacterized protein n=1 Tax=Dreissena polymorpha TaxID=45954 RepID=A0A9D4MRA5_DREPO|nr:hypothetical protein DPMN_004257 [Dreissena polymorpha]
MIRRNVLKLSHYFPVLPQLKQSTARQSSSQPWMATVYFGEAKAEPRLSTVEPR